ncbi:MAG: hypothetical protein NVS3B5_05730 [Sphingomicrobium sp.]
MRVVKQAEGLVRHPDEENRNAEFQDKRSTIEAAGCLAPPAQTDATKAGGADRARINPEARSRG